MKDLSNLTKVAERYVARRMTGYKYTMGGTSRLNVTHCGEVLFVVNQDNREYYSGRGSKYNRTVRHDHIEETITVNALRAYRSRCNKAAREAKAVAAADAILRKKERAERLVKEATVVDQTVAVGGVEIVGNEGGHPCVSSVANLAGTPLIEKYHGCGRGSAMVKDGRVFDIAYDVVYDGWVRCDFSCTQICF